MGLLSIPAPVRQRHARPWPRQHRRPWVRPDDADGLAVLLAAIPSLPRATLARLTTHLIDRMDELDGDEQDDDGDGRDLSWAEWHSRWEKLSPAGHEIHLGEIVSATEDDEDDDPAGGALDDVGEMDDSRPDGIKLDRPRYGVDQSLGPVNEAEMYRNYHAALCAQ